MLVPEYSGMTRRASSTSATSTTPEQAPESVELERKGAVEADAPPPPAEDVVFPDGGYGWVIMAAFSVNTMFVVQLSMVFGLILTEAFRELDMPKTGVATIMTFNQSFSLLFGLVSGSLVRRFGYRRVAVVGVVLASCGMVLTAFSTSFMAFMVTYGVIMSAGAGLTTPAFSVALNSYFKKRRSLVTGLALGLTGASGVLFPQIVSAMLKYLGSSWTCVGCGGLSLFALVAAAFLDPVEQHRPHAVCHTAGGTTREAGAAGLARQLARLLDLKLLGSGATMVLLLGLAVSNMAEITFKTMVPFILAERGQDRQSVATFLSLTSGTAALGKLAAPLLQALAGLSSKGMYVAVLLVVICARVVLVLVTDYSSLLVLAVVLGVTKGVRAVFYNLVIPDHVHLEQLAPAIGLQAAFTGVFLLVNGPVIGVIRENSSSYNVVIMTCNGITASCILAWAVELLVQVVRRRSKRSKASRLA
ncbi:monocarboxylate transporter 10-like [Thrips palmi]|uniref:Monocarboxylate transporter 10-like n=1 Tax=Thrips palmi TaxID=161013 RepID=A0A6P8YJW6_THRPL|nr:monocarboxylate transporter 10-like [Thrips palmi]